MAGLSYTPGNPEDVQEYLDHYAQLKDDDKKFTLMEMILDAIAQHDISNRVIQKPLKRFFIH